MESLRHLREQAGYSQQDLADKTGVSQHTISEIELGRRKPQGRTLRKLAEALDVKVADLVGGNARPKARALSPRDAEPATALPDDKVLFEISYSPGNAEEAIQEAAREAKRYPVPEGMQRALLDNGEKVAVRFVPISAPFYSTSTRRKRRTTTKTQRSREAG